MFFFSTGCLHQCIRRPRFDDNLPVTFRGGLKSDDTGHHAFIFMKRQGTSVGKITLKNEDRSISIHSFLHVSIVPWNLTDLPRNVVVKADERNGILESNDMDVVCLVKRNAADECLDQESCSYNLLLIDVPKWISSSIYTLNVSPFFTYYLILGSHFGDALPVRAPNLEQRAHDSPASSQADAVQGETLPQRGGHPGQAVSVRHGGPGCRISIGYLSKPEPRPTSSIAVVSHSRPTGYHSSWIASCCRSSCSSNDFRSAIWMIDYFAFCIICGEKGKPA